MSKKINNGYIVIANNSKTNEKVYMALDHSSGGYPFWTVTFKLANVFSNLATAASNVPAGNRDSYLLKDVNREDVKIYQMLVELVEVNDDTIMSIKREEALSKLTLEDRMILGLEE